jgi:predicted nucleotide-binding protein (sugar kinase/HSP70/actin superfamily)
MIEASELGAEFVIMADSQGWCILRCYNIVQAEIMKTHGYTAKMAPICVRKPFKFFKDARRLAPGLSAVKLVVELSRLYRKAKELDSAEMSVNNDADIRVGIAGEVYVCNESAVNMDIVRKLQAMGVFVDRWLCLSRNLSMLAREALGMGDSSGYARTARKYFPERIGGHANENLVKLIRYAEEGYDGAVMLKPFACNPETVIEPIVDRIARDYNMPILSLSIDESTLETHFDTRLESFVDMLKMRKKGSV